MFVSLTVFELFDCWQCILLTVQQCVVRDLFATFKYLTV